MKFIPRRENFTNSKPDSVLLELWDDFYAKVYDTIFNNKHRMDWEWSQISEFAISQWSVTKTKLVDLGCGTGFYAPYALNDNVKYLGIDNSSYMLDVARKKAPDGKFQSGNILIPTTFSPDTFTHALCMYFTIYYNPKVIFRNAYSWLQNGGYLIVHAVDPQNFDPILEVASPFPVFSVQKYSKSRITKSEVQFDEFKYKSNFKKSVATDDATFEEVFEFPDETTRTHRHNLTMPDLDKLIHIAETMGFTLEEKIDMVAIEWEYNYLLVFKK